MMKAAENCINLIEQFEGFSDKPYLCPAGVWTIGYGSTRYENGVSVKSTDKPITKKRARELVYAMLAREFEPAVNKYVTVKLNQNQFDALVDFAYNLGSQNLRTSTLLKKLNAGDYEGAATEFNKWIYANGKKLPGLVKRRKAEQCLFLS